MGCLRDLYPFGGADKIDEAIDLKKQSFFPIFVRMSDQVENLAEYEKLCRDAPETVTKPQGSFICS